MMVKIDGFDIICLKEFTIEREINKHSICKFEAYIDEKNLNQSFKNLNKKVQVSSIKDEVEEKIFFGVVKSIESLQNFHDSRIEVEIISTSFLESIEKKERVFQNQEKNNQNIFECLKMKDLTVDIVDENIKNEKLDVPIFQIEESNFDFIKRVAMSYGSYLVVDDISNANIKIKLGVSQQKKYDLNNEKYKIKSIKKDISAESITVALEKKLLIGDILIFDGIEYTIESSILEYKSGVLLYKYDAKKQDKQEKNRFKILGNKEYECEVSDNKDPESKGRIKVKFKEELEECEPGEGYWFDFLTNYSGKDTGIVFLQEIGDLVSVKEISGRVYAENSRRVDTNEEYLNNPNIKTIKNMFDKSITFQEKMIEIKNGKGTGEDEETNIIRLLDEGLEIKVGNKKIIIDKERILLENKDVKIEIGNEKLILSSSAGNGIQIEKDNIKIKTTNDIKTESKTLEITGSKATKNSLVVE